MLSVIIKPQAFERSLFLFLFVFFFFLFFACIHNSNIGPTYSAKERLSFPLSSCSSKHARDVTFGAATIKERDKGPSSAPILTCWARDLACKIPSFPGPLLFASKEKREAVKIRRKLARRPFFSPTWEEEEWKKERKMMLLFFLRCTHNTQHNSTLHYIGKVALYGSADSQDPRGINVVFYSRQQTRLGTLFRKMSSLLYLVLVGFFKSSSLDLCAQFTKFHESLH